MQNSWKLLDKTLDQCVFLCYLVSKVLIKVDVIDRQQYPQPYLFASPLANNPSLIINKPGSGVATILLFLLHTLAFKHKLSSGLTFKLTHFIFNHGALQLLHKS